MDDRYIVELFERRDPAAIRETQDAYGRQLTAIAMAVLSDPQDAEECVSDGLLRAWNSIPPHKPTFLGAFLGKIVRQLAIDRLRAREANKRGGGEYLLSLEELSQCVGGTGADFEWGALTEAIGNYLKTVPSETRWMFLRRYFHFDSINEIARQGRISQSKVKSTLFRTRQGLRDYLKKEGFDL